MAQFKLELERCTWCLSLYPNGSAKIKVIAGTMFRNAHENVAEVYSSPRRKRYCVSVALEDFFYRFLVIYKIRRIINKNGAI